MKQNWKRLLSGLLVLVFLMTGMGYIPEVQAADQTEVYMTNGRKVGYNEHFTHEFTLADGTQAFCLQPSKKSPPTGTYTATKSDDRWLAAVFYYGYGGSGWDTPAGLRNITDPISRDDVDMHIYWTHVLAAYVYGSDDAFKGVDAGTQEGLKNIAAYWRNVGVPAGYSAYIFNAATSSQAMGYGYEEPAGDLEIQKSSSNPSITNGNACYSLEGAVYQLLDGNGSVAATLKTDVNGYARADGIPPGSYTLKEVTAPKGYLLDETPISITIISGQTTSVPVTDEPGNDPITISLQKVDKDTGDIAQAKASLAGAQFTIKYYAGYYDKNTLPAQATRTWVIETVKVENPSTGEIVYTTALRDAFKVSGDDFYHNKTGGIVLPLGTITIQETKAPDGYLLEGAYLEPTGGGQKVEGVYLSQITQQGNLVRLEGGNEYTISDSVLRGGVKIQKYDADTETAAPQGDATLAGARFDIVNLNDGPVSIDGKTYASGQTVLTLTTNADGLAQTAADTLPAGHYKVVETTAPSGYLGTGVVEREFDITSNEGMVDLTTPETGILNDVIKGSILIAKHTDDGETGIETPEVGAEFQVYLKSAGSYEAAGELERDTITCDEDGFAQTKELPYGTYVVHQTKSWDGRDLVDDFEVSINSDGQVYRFIINNRNFESYLKVVKVDAETGKAIAYAGAGFQIYDPDGNLVTMRYTYPTVSEVDTFYTAADGSLMTPERLPYGKGYTLVEVQAPYGYVLDSTPVAFGIAPESAGEEGDHTVIRLTKSDQPQKGTITVTKTGEAFASVVTREEDGRTVYQPLWESGKLSGAVFEVRAAEDIVTLDGTLRCAKGELVDTLTTGADGTATSKALYLGKYEVKEVTAPDGMVLNGEPQEVELTYAGQDVALTETGTEFENDRQKAEVTLTKTMEEAAHFGYDKAAAGEALKDVRFGLYAAEEIKAADGTAIPADGLLEILAPGEDGSAKALTDLPLGSYYVQEIATNEAYILDDTKYPVEFAYAGQDTALVEIAANDGKPIENELIRGSIVGSKRDYDNLGVPGAVIGLFAADTKYFTEETALRTTVSGEDGSFTFWGVPYGTYLIRELEAPEGYLLNETVYEVTVAEDKEKVPVDVVDWEIPTIHTTLIDAKTETKNVLAESAIELIDEVRYEDLIPGQTYLIRGILMDKADETGNTPILADKADETGNTPILADKADETGNTPILVNGKEVVSSLTFVPEERKGTMEVTFQLDGSSLAGKTIVAYEQLYLPRHGVENPNPENLEDWMLVTAHEDMEDGAQTVYVPKLGTTLTDTATGEHCVMAGETVTLTDRTRYENLIPSRTYLIRGTLMDQETGEPLMVDGKPVEGTRLFIPEEAEGYADVAYVFAGDDLAGRTLTAYETLYIAVTEEPDPEKPEDWGTVAEHKDLEDVSQTVYFPKLGTTLTDTATGEHQVKERERERITLTDQVRYENLIPGETYQMNGILMDRETGKPLLVGGRPVEGSVVFVPTEPEGYVEMPFTFDGTGLAGKYLVAFESLSIAVTENPDPEEPEDWAEVGSHEDIGDEGQTVYVEKPVEPARTGDGMRPMALAAVCFAGAGGALYFAKQDRKRKQRTGEEK